MARAEVVVNQREKKSDKEILHKAVATSAPVKKPRGTKNLAQTIETIRQSVEDYLGDKKDSFELITTKDRLAEYVSVCVKNGICALDTETTSVDVFTCDIVGFSLYTPGEKPCYVPINHVDYTTNVRLTNQISEHDAGVELKKLSGTKIIFFNAKFDIKVIRHTLNVYLNPYYDAYIAARLLNENEPENGLKALHKKYVLHGEADAFSFSELFDKMSFAVIPIDIGYLYAARDAIVTYELYLFQKPFLDKGSDICKEFELEGVSDVFWNIEMPIVTVIADMEDRGVKLDFDYQKVLSDEYNKELKIAEEKFYQELAQYTDHQYLISSSKQLCELFYDDLKILKPVWDRKAQKSKRTVDAETLSNIDHPLAKLILDYRMWQKLISTYVDKMAVLAERDGRVHGLFNQVGTDTGRFSSSDPKSNWALAW